LICSAVSDEEKKLSDIDYRKEQMLVPSSIRDHSYKTFLSSFLLS